MSNYYIILSAKEKCGVSYVPNGVFVTSGVVSETELEIIKTVIDDGVYYLHRYYQNAEIKLNFCSNDKVIVDELINQQGQRLVLGEIDIIKTIMDDNES